ncbi:PIN-like domain-containing protein [Burkholderia gladioli]|uniref:PIN-like domain-containing protein n=1 Tax=Burkholderia gladioli TaxID=28095 RepID=UPI001C616249|nr:PIN-like domain-containing protein [Burkholderia gladioli]
MSEIDKLLKIHRNSDELDFKKIWADGLFIFDANVMLDLYRLPQSASKDLMSVLENEKFKDRAWIGFQVALEFLNNRHDAIGDQKSKFATVKELVEAAISGYDAAASTLQSDLAKLKLKQRHSVIDPDRYINSDRIENSTSYLKEFLAELKRLELSQSDVSDHDSIKEFVFKTFDGKIGEGLDKARLDAVYRDGERRYEAEIPPGYKDKKKEGAYKFEGKDYIRKYGDLVLWNEIIDKAKNSSYKYIVLVTGDVKEDWWSERRGKRLGPRKELLDEIYAEAPNVDTFHMYDTSNFLQYAKDYLDENIKESSINDVKDLIALNRYQRRVSDEGLISIVDAIKAASSGFHGLRVGIGRSAKELPFVKVNPVVLHEALLEIFTNVFKHSRDSYVGVQAKEGKNIVQVRFKNKKDAATQVFHQIGANTVTPLEGPAGLWRIKDILAREQVDVHTRDAGTVFVVELFIPKSV